MSDIIEIDGSIGGGQVLRTALALSVGLMLPFRMKGIRGSRPKPGLMRQHLTCVQAAAAVSDAEVIGAYLGSTELEFFPRRFKAGDYHFDIGSGGSVTLVFQALLPMFLASLEVGQTASVTVTGGTHCPMAPVWEFMAETWLPSLAPLGFDIETSKERAGFHQIGGGRASVRISRRAGLAAPIHIMERGSYRGAEIEIISSHLPEDVAEREFAELAQTLLTPLGLKREDIVRTELTSALGSGNAVIVRLHYDFGTSVFSALGLPSTSAENVASHVARRVLEFFRGTAPVSHHLADQLLVPMVLGGGGSFLTWRPSQHTRTSAEVIKAFTGQNVRMEQQAEGWKITVGDEK